MRTVDRRTCRQALPSWGVETLRVLANTHAEVADIERELRYATRLQGVEPRIGAHLQLLRDALGVVQLSLSVCEHTTQEVFAEIIATSGV